MVEGPGRLASSGDATPALLAAYAEWFGRPFPPGLLPGEPLYRVASDALVLTTARASARSEGSRGESIDLCFGSTAARAGQDLIPFSRAAFMCRAPAGYFVAGFAARSRSDLMFYYMRRDAWSRAMFRFPCERLVSRGRGATIPRFLERFDVFARSARPRVASLAAFEMDGMAGSYEITVGRRAFVFDRSRFDDCDFEAMLG